MLRTESQDGVLGSTENQNTRDIPKYRVVSCQAWQRPGSQCPPRLSCLAFLCADIFPQALSSTAVPWSSGVCTTPSPAVSAQSWNHISPLSDKNFLEASLIRPGVPGVAGASCVPDNALGILGVEVTLPEKLPKRRKWTRRGHRQRFIPVTPCKMCDFLSLCLLLFRK